MNKIDSIREIQKIELNILKTINLFCKENEIKYTLYYGTMLGAVRHKGFIPWDDDIDIAMFRDEYEKFLNKVKALNYRINKNIEVITPKNKGFRPFIKVIDNTTYYDERNIKKEYRSGLWIDVFPIDYIYEDEGKSNKLIKRQIRINRQLLRMSSLYSSNKFKYILKKFNNKINKIIGINEKELLNKCMNIPMLEKSCKCACVVWPEGNKEIIPSSYFNEYTKIKFEDSEFMCISKYKEFLNVYYGDYLKLPPIKQRKSHNVTAYTK